MLASQPPLPEPPQRNDAPLSTSRSAPVSTDTVDSTRLLQGRRELRIRHGNETYRLRHTRNDKLILTK